MLICSLLASVAQLFYKAGAQRLDWEIYSLILNWPLALGLTLYAIALAFMLVSYRHGELTLLYPLFSTTYIWVALFAALIYPDEVLSLKHVLGVASILLGTTTIGWDS